MVCKVRAFVHDCWSGFTFTCNNPNCDLPLYMSIKWYSADLLESTAIHNFELVVSRDLVHKNHTWTVRQMSCTRVDIGSGLHAKEPFCEKLIFVVKVGLHTIKIRSFQEEQFKRRSTWFNSDNQGEFKNLWRGNYWRSCSI